MLDREYSCRSKTCNEQLIRNIIGLIVSPQKKRKWEEARYDLRQSRKIHANLGADLRTSDLDVCYLIARKNI